MSVAAKTDLIGFTNSGLDLPQIEVIEGERQLDYGSVLSLERRGQTFHVVSGCAWITVDGEDLIVLADESIVLEPGLDPAVVSALEAEPLVYRINAALEDESRLLDSL